MHIDFPYSCDINNREEAVYFIKNKCSNCHRYIDCSGLNANKCDNVTAELLRLYGTKKVKIDLPNELTALAGNEYGREIFDTFVEPKMNYGKIVVEFPENIRMVAIGFVQGFIYKLGVQGFKEKVEIKGNPLFVEKFLSRLE